MRTLTYAVVLGVIVLALLIVSLLPYITGAHVVAEKKPPVTWGYIKITMPDIVLSAYYAKPTSAPPKALVVIVPGSREVSNAWNATGLPRQLALRGYGVVLFDLRGHGGSNMRPNGSIVNAASLTETDYERMVLDLEAVVKTFKNYFRVDKVFIVGSDIGASITVLYAYKSNWSVNGVVVVSPTFDAKIPFPLKLFIEYLKNGGRAAIIYSQGDAYAVKVVKEINAVNFTELNITKPTFYASGKLGHGVSLLFNDKTIPSRIAAIIDSFYALSLKKK